MDKNRSYFPSWQSYKTKESSSLLEMIVSPFELKSKQLILSEFSRNTLATLKLRSTLSVSFMMASVGLWGEAGPRSTLKRLTGVTYGGSCAYIYELQWRQQFCFLLKKYSSKTATKARLWYPRSPGARRRRREGKAPPSPPHRWRATSPSDARTRRKPRETTAALAMVASSTRINGSSVISQHCELTIQNRGKVEGEIKCCPWLSPAPNWIVSLSAVVRLKLCGRPTRSSTFPFNL